MHLHQYASIGLILGCLPLLGGCAQDGTGGGGRETGYAVVGGVGCGVGAALAGGGTILQRAVRGIAGGAACAAVGSMIGRALDERDRARANAATYAVLRQRIPPGYYQPAAATYAVPPAQQPTRVASLSSPRMPIRTNGYTTPAPTADAMPAEPVAPPPVGRLPGVPVPTNAQWVSDHTGSSGSSTVIRVEAATATTGECRTVREVAQAGGRSLSEDRRLCESRAGADDWKPI